METNISYIRSGINSQGNLSYEKYEIEELSNKYRLITASNTGDAYKPIITRNKTVQSIIDAKQLDGMNFKRLVCEYLWPDCGRYRRV